MVSGNISAALAGKYFTARNPTPGTPIAGAVSAAMSESAAYFLAITARNPAKRVSLDYIRLICGVAPTNGTAGNYLLKVTSARRYVSGGTLLQPVQPNMAESGVSASVIHAGALTTANPDPTGDRIIGGGVLRTAIPIAGDEWALKFGAKGTAGYALSGGTAAERMVIPAPPVILGPEQTLLLALWFPISDGAAQFEAEIGFAEE
jgi:hypothetical protein